MRTASRDLLMGALVFLGYSTAVAADYPERNITLVVPFAPGGTTDIVARLVVEHMAKTLGQSIIVENDSGAGGTLAGRRVAQAAADGYTLIMGTLGTHGAAPSQYPNLKYDPRRDFTPIGQTSEMPFVLVTRKDFPVNNLKEFVEYVQSNQDKVSEAHAGVGEEDVAGAAARLGPTDELRVGGDDDGTRAAGLGDVAPRRRIRAGGGEEARGDEDGEDAVRHVDRLSSWRGPRSPVTHS